MFKEWISAGLEKKGKSHQGLANALGIDRTVISKIISGVRQLKAEEIVRVAAYLDEPPPSRMMPVSYTIGAGGEIFAVDGDAAQDFLPISGMWGVDAELALIKGTSMLPLFGDGTKIIFGVARKPNQQLDHNRMRVVRLADDRHMVKIMKRTSDPAVWDLESLNAPPIEGRVVVAVAEILRIEPH